jgi:hypothetical protein
MNFLDHSGAEANEVNFEMVDLQVQLQLSQIELLETGLTILSTIDANKEDTANIVKFYGALFNTTDGDRLATYAGYTIEGVIGAISSAIKKAWDAIINFFKRLFGFATTSAVVGEATRRIDEINNMLDNKADFFWKADVDPAKLAHIDTKYFRDKTADMAKIRRTLSSTLRGQEPEWTIKETLFDSVRDGAKEIIPSKEEHTAVLDKHMATDFGKLYVSGDSKNAKEVAESIATRINLLLKNIEALASDNMRFGDLRFDGYFQKGGAQPASGMRYIAYTKSEKEFMDPMECVRAYAKYCDMFICDAKDAIHQLETISRCIIMDMSKY